MDMESKMIKLKKTNIKWLHWFVGFSDAEGCFQVFPKKRLLKSGEVSKISVGCYYHLSLHKREAEVIKSVKENLNNIGVIYKYDNKSDVRLAINSKSDLLYLINNVFDIYSLITKHQLVRYSFLRSTLINEVKEFKSTKLYDEYKSESLSVLNKINTNHNLESIFNNPYLDNWIVGFINGEGCFYLNKNKCSFFIEHTDKLALCIIKDRLAFGPRVTERAPRSRDIGKERKTTYKLHVSSEKDIKTLIEFLDNDKNIPLQGHKFIQYTEWKRSSLVS